MFETQTIDIMDYETVILERLTSELYDVVLSISIMGMLVYCGNKLVGWYLRRKEVMRTEKAIKSEGEKTRTFVQSELRALAPKVPEKQKPRRARVLFPSRVLPAPDVIEYGDTIEWDLAEEESKARLDRIRASVGRMTKIVRRWKSDSDDWRRRNA